MPPRQQHPRATTALTLGLVAVIGAFVCAVPILLSPAAWWTGARALREIDAEPDAWGGRELAVAGKVLGIVGTALLALGVLAVAGLVALLVGA